ncbi:hypothetical protein [Peptoanaerobacter stomatis]
MNTISLTIRIPMEIYNKLELTSKSVGFTKVTFIRIAIFTYLSENKTILTFDKSESSEKHRFVLNVNETAYDLLTQASNEYNQSINSIVISLIIKYLEFFSKVLPELDL